MTKNPLYNAISAIAYIVIFVTSLILGPQYLGGPEESIFYPMLGLAFLVLSVAVMAYLFFYQPLLMLLDGQRPQAVKLFLRTVGIFAACTAILLVVSITVRG